MSSPRGRKISPRKSQSAVERKALKPPSQLSDEDLPYITGNLRGKWQTVTNKVGDINYKIELLVEKELGELPEIGDSFDNLKLQLKKLSLELKKAGLSLESKEEEEQKTSDYVSIITRNLNDKFCLDLSNFRAVYDYYEKVKHFKKSSPVISALEREKKPLELEMEKAEKLYKKYDAELTKRYKARKGSKKGSRKA